MRALHSLLVAVALAGGCTTTPDSSWAEGLASMGSVSDGALRVLYPRDAPWGEQLAKEVLEVLRRGRAVAREQAGLDDGPFAVALVETAPESGESYARQPFRDPEGGLVYSAFPMPVGASQDVAAAYARGERLATAAGGPLAAARHIAVFLEVHELAHVMLEHTLGPREFHLWMNEGLAEYVAVATGMRHYPADTRRFLRSRDKELDWLGAGKSVDFLRWSPASGGEAQLADTLPDGSLVRYGWDDVRDPLQVREALETLRTVSRATGESEDGERTERLWREWLGVLESAPGESEVDVDSGDWPKRWGVYAMLFAFFWEAAGQAGEDGLAPVIAELRPLTENRYTVADPSEIGAIDSLTAQPVLFATNDQITVALFAATGSDAWRELVRGYGVTRARGVIRTLMDALRPE